VHLQDIVRGFPGRENVSLFVAGEGMKPEGAVDVSRATQVCAVEFRTESRRKCNIFLYSDNYHDYHCLVFISPYCRVPTSFVLTPRGDWESLSKASRRTYLAVHSISSVSEVNLVRMAEENCQVAR
jgi:hypothetical protein